MTSSTDSFMETYHELEGFKFKVGAEFFDRHVYSKGIWDFFLLVNTLCAFLAGSDVQTILGYLCSTTDLTLKTNNFSIQVTRIED